MGAPTEGGQHAPVRPGSRPHGHKRHRRSVHAPGGRGWLQCKLLKKDNVAVAFFGDGAVNNAAFHEGLNLAAIWKLPVLFVCENNQFATEVPFIWQPETPAWPPAAAGYGMPGVELDGNDVLAIRRRPVRRSPGPAGGGPTLFECKTYRTRPHAEGMGDFTYRTREEVDAWKTRCPIQRLRHLVLTGGTERCRRFGGDRECGAAVRSRRHSESRKRSPWPDPATADHPRLRRAATTGFAAPRCQATGKITYSRQRSKR